MKALGLALVGTCALGLLPAAAQADGRVTFTSGGGALSGGSFNFQVDASGPGFNYSVGTVLHTFCVETGEFISYGAHYFAVIGQQIDRGDPGNGGTPHTTLEAQTAFLYSSWAHGTLSGIGTTMNGAFGSGGGVSGFAQFDQDALQEAIWYFQGQNYLGEEGNFPSQWRADLAIRRQSFINAANNAIANHWVNTDVGIMNIYSDSAHLNPAQSQLVLVPLPRETAMAGIGLVGLIGARVSRRRRS